MREGRSQGTAVGGFRHGPRRGPRGVSPFHLRPEATRFSSRPHGAYPALRWPIPSISGSREFSPVAGADCSPLSGLLCTGAQPPARTPSTEYPALPTLLELMSAV